MIKVRSKMVHCPQEDNGTTVYMLVIVMNFVSAKSLQSTKSNWNVSFVYLSLSFSAKNNCICTLYRKHNRALSLHNLCII